ncbi:MAG: DUF2145 domain-containing protein [Comamonas sp.]
MAFTKTICLLAALLATAPAAIAGRSCEPRRPTVATIRQGLTLALQVQQQLDASGARVVLLGRQGQDLGRYGVQYSHMGWAYQAPTGQWRVVHKLNDCGTARAHVYRQGLGEFFLDDLWRYQAVVMLPTPAVQQALLLALSNNAQPLALHEGAYSMVSYAWGTRYQQSNQWALETLALAMEPTRIHSREQAQAWLRLQGYAPADLRLGALTRLGGRIAQANVAFDDHPPQRRFAGHIETVTVDSALRFLQQSGLAGAPQVVQ